MGAEENSPGSVPPQSASQPPWVTRVFIVDDHRFFTFALTSLINTEADLTVCGSGCDEQNVVTDVVRTQPDVVVMDLNLSQHDGVKMAAAVRGVARGIPILFVSSLQNPQFEVDSRWLEPCSFVEKTKDPADIIQGIRQTLAKFHLHQNQFPNTTSFSS